MKRSELYDEAMATTAIETSRIPGIYRAFAAAIGAETWQRRAQRMRAAMKGMPVLTSLLLEENDIAFALERWGALAGGVLRIGPVPVSSSLLPAIGFAAQCLHVIRSLGAKEGQAFVKRVRGVFDDPTGMRGLQLELQVATHFSKCEWRVEWPADTGLPIFDFLATSRTGQALEVECKAISPDKGRAITRRESLEFLSPMVRDLERLIAGVDQGLSLTVTLPDRLPKGLPERANLAREVVRALVSGRDSDLADGTQIRIGDVPQGQIPSSMPKSIEDFAAFRAQLDAATATRNREALVLGRGDGRGLVMVVQSARDDSTVKRIHDTLREAAGRQLSGSRAGAVVVGFTGLSSAEVRSLADLEGQPGSGTELGRIAGELLSAEHRRHLAIVSYLSASDMQQNSPNSIARSGATLTFFNRRSRFWHDDFSGIFPGSTTD